MAVISNKSVMHKSSFLLNKLLKLLIAHITQKLFHLVDSVLLPKNN